MKTTRKFAVAVALWILRRLTMIGLCFAILYLHAFVGWLDKDKDFDTIHSPIQPRLFKYIGEDVL